MNSCALIYLILTFFFPILYFHINIETLSLYKYILLFDNISNGNTYDLFIFYISDILFPYIQI